MTASRFLRIICFPFLSLLFFSFGLLTQHGWADEKYVIRFAHGFPDDHFMSKQYKEWAGLIEQRSKNVKIEMFPAAQLYKDLDLIRAIERGAVESGGTISFTLATSVPEYTIFQLPFTFKSTDQLIKVVKSEIGAALSAGAEKKGFKVLATLALPLEGIALVSKKALKTPSDCKGLVFRVIDPLTANLAKLWGAGGSFLSGAEQYMALQRGTINGTFAAVSTSAERKLYEVAPHCVVIPYAFPVNPLVMNRTFFSKMPKALQDTIVEVSDEITARAPQRAMENHDWAMKLLKGKGFEPYIPSKEEMILWEKGVQPIRESVMQGFPQGLEFLKKVDTLLK
jgi:C4-dicarboxylate-binding protein DctP